MKICRFNEGRLGLVEGAVIKDVTQALDLLPGCSYPFPKHDLLIEHFDRICEKAKLLAPGAPEVALDSVKLLSPVANPGKVIAAPVNYMKHLNEAREQAEIHNNNRIEEIQRVGLFLKATSSVVGCGEGVQLVLYPDRRNDHEAELVVVIGKTAKKVSPSDALNHVAGYCTGLDMTIRGPEERSLRKSPDSYSVVGPWIVTKDELDDPDSIEFTLCVDGEVRQHANTRDLIIGVRELIAFASRFYTLHPGDLLFTGTPEGVAPVVPGNTITTEFSGIGNMVVQVR